MNAGKRFWIVVARALARSLAGVLARRSFVWPFFSRLFPPLRRPAPWPRGACRRPANRFTLNSRASRPTGNSPSASAANSMPCPRPTWSAGDDARSRAGEWRVVLADGSLAHGRHRRRRQGTAHRQFGSARHAQAAAGIARRPRLPDAVTAGRPRQTPGSPARATGDADRLLLHNGDELTGLLTGIADEVAKLDTDVGPVEIKLDRAAALILNPTLKHKPPKDHRFRAWAA